VVALAAIGIAVAYLLASIVAILLPAGVRRGAWLPLHLALAGGATTAIAGIMPYFTAAFAAAPPRDSRLRMTAVGAVALGALGVSLGVVGEQSGLAAAGGVGFIAGIGLTGVAAIRPLGQGLGPSRGLVTQGYVIALVEVALGASVATLFVAGWTPLVDAWAHVKPAHAWLNLIGFVSLVIATTMLHFFPTVVGARIARRPSARITVVGLAVGAPLVALGFALASDAIARVGAIGVAAGSAGLALYGWRTWQARAHWTTDPAWHRFAIGGLVSAITWFEVGMTIATGRVLAFGADPAAWWVEGVAGPLVVGWIALTIVASATHLIPAVGPGNPAAHARQRQLLGRASTLRLAIIDVGIAVLSVGLSLRLGPLTAVGIVCVAVGLAATAALLGAAVRIGVGSRAVLSPG